MWAGQSPVTDTSGVSFHGPLPRWVFPGSGGRLLAPCDWVNGPAFTQSLRAPWRRAGGLGWLPGRAYFLRESGSTPIPRQDPPSPLERDLLGKGVRPLSYAAP